MSLNRNASSTTNAFLWHYHLFSEYRADGQATAVNTKLTRGAMCPMLVAGKSLDVSAERRQVVGHCSFLDQEC